MKVYVLDSGVRGMKKLIVGGLHGREGEVVKPILERFAHDGGPRSGVLIVVPSLCERSKYVSTLSKKYLETEEGMKLLSLLEHYRPDVYVEVHCYSKRAYKLLTSPDRMARKGVPELVELEKGLLIGSSPPHLLLRNLFKFGMTVEIPCRGYESHELLLMLLRIVRDQETIKELLNNLVALYPGQLHKAVMLCKAYKEKVMGAINVEDYEVCLPNLREIQ